MYRHFPQTQAYYYFNCEIKNPVKTADGGYIFSYFPWSPNLHSMGPLDYYTIKTDSNFIPEWKKPYYASAISLPTGGIILVYGSTIEKVTPSGTQIWIKHMSSSESTIINDGVSYSDKIRFVGRKSGNTGYPYFGATSQAYTLLMDTAGSFISHSLYTTSYAGDADFSKIKRDLQGNFFVYSNQSDLMLSASNMSLAKFDASFNFVWGKTWSSSSQPLLVSDIDILPNGRIFATGMIRGNYPYSYPAMGALLKFDSQGNLLDQKYFEGRYKISGLSKLLNGNYIVSSSKGFQDSLFLFETDTAMNVSWYKNCGRGTAIGTSIQKNNTLFTPTFYGSNPVIISNSINGNSCASYSMTYSKLTSTVNLSSFTLSAATSSAAVYSGTINVLNTQSYLDSCKCPVFIPVLQNNLCVGNTGTIGIIGHGNLSWYSTATGSTFIQSGNQFVYTSNTPTVKTVYAQDSSCGANPTRTQINITVYSIPVLTLSPLNPTICAGSQVFVSASGANSYSWTSFQGNSYVQNFNPSVSSNYTVTGTVAPGCSDTKTMSVSVVAPPSITLSPLPPICIGSTATLNALGAATYTWYWPGNVSANTPSLSVTPTSPGQSFYTVYGSNGFCSSSQQATVIVSSYPSISAFITPSVICAGQSSTLTAIGAASYTWNTSSTNYSLVESPSVSTIYTLQGANLYNCVSSETLFLTVIPQPTLNISSSAYSVCEGAQVTLSATGASSYSWSNGFNTNSFTVAAPNGISVYTLTGANSICTKTASTQLYAFPNPSISFVSSPSVFCEGKTTTISALGANSFTWSNFSTNNNIVVTPTTHTTLIVYGANGTCIQSDSINLIVYPNPTIALTVSDQDLCLGESVSLLVSGANYYLWNTGSIMNLIYETPLITTNYSIMGTSANGCSDSKAVTINVHSLPQIIINSSKPNICVGESCTLTASGALSYSWSSGTGSSLIVTPVTTSIFTVSGTDVNGCLGTGSINQLVNLCTGMGPSFESNPLVSISPNPSLSYFVLHLNSFSESSYAIIYTSSGSVIHEQKITSSETHFDFSSEVSGVYYLKLSGLEKPYAFKLVKQ
jgi:hypothetical protein